jgi:ubiquinone/menaquinone biosynthesis C-methylase UbiE
MDSAEMTESNLNATNLFQTVWKVPNYQRALINYMIKGSNRRSLVEKIKNVTICDRNDNDIMKEIIDMIGHKKHITNDRTKNRTDDILNLLSEIDNGGDFIATRPSLQPTLQPTILDYGCGDGQIAICLASHINITDPGNIYCVDIKPANITGARYLSNTSTIPSGSINLAIALVSFHHMKNVNDNIAELRRVITADGILIIREHDFDGSIAQRAYLDLIHLYADMTNNEPFDQPNYQSSAAWTQKLQRYGFSLKKITKLAGNNPQGLYYAVYCVI